MLTIILRLAYLAAIGLSAYTACWLVFRADKSRAAGALTLCQVLIILWCVPQLFLGFPLTRELKYVMYGISYMGISFIGPAWLTFACLYRRRQIGRFLPALFFLLPAFHYAAFLTNEFHHLFYRGFEVEQVVYGPVFYVHMVYTYGCVMAGLLMVLREFKKNGAPSRLMTLILAAVAIPLAMNVLYMVGGLETGFDLTPPVFALTSLLMLLAVFRYDFLDVNAVAFEGVLDTIAEGVVIYNKKGRITYCNSAAQQWFSIRSKEPVSGLRRILQDLGGDAGQDGSFGEDCVISPEEGRRLQIRHYRYCDRKGTLEAGTFLFTDVSRYYELLERDRELAISNQKLAIEQERNRIAQEVHDTTGHTLTMIHSLLRLAKTEYALPDRRDEVHSCLCQAQELAGGGIRELRCAINHMKQTEGCGLVTQGICQLAGRVKGLEIEVTVQGEDGTAYSHLSALLYECFREAVTNALRYSGASHMDAILKFTEEGIQAYFIDNGSGCSQIEEGNGLKGIRQRVEQAGGQVQFLSSPEDGFKIYMKLPLRTGGAI